MSIKLLLSEVVIELGLDALLFGHPLEGFLHQLKQPVFFFTRHDDAVMECSYNYLGYKLGIKNRMPNKQLIYMRFK